MERIYDIEDVGILHNKGEYNATDFDLLAIARVLNDDMLMYDALRWSAMLTSKSAYKAVYDAAKAVAEPSQCPYPPLDLTAIRKQARGWLKEHGTTLTAIKRDYNSRDYINLYALNMRTITYYKVPAILADLIARTGNYIARDLTEG